PSGSPADAAGQSSRRPSDRSGGQADGAGDKSGLTARDVIILLVAAAAASGVIGLVAKRTK
uniref:hypothetical protein n=1 Tax=Nonomuraea lactucae TaxID=2249762 RepID=UPI0013B41B2A